MGSLLSTLRAILTSVFGRSDYLHLLSDDFELDPEMEEAGPAALHRQAQAKRAPKPPTSRRRRQPPPPTPLQETVAQGLARDTYGTISSLELPDAGDFDWSADFSVAEDQMEAPSPVPRETVLRLVHRARPEPVANNELLAGRVESTGAYPPSHGGALALATSPIPEQVEAVRVSTLFGPPPSSLWDEQEIKMEILEQLDAEREVPPEGVELRDWRVVLDRLARALGNLSNELPPLPSSAASLLRGSGRGPTDEEVIDAIKGDPALAARMVKAANSPFYMAARPASSLPGAIVRMGLQEARKLAMAAAFEETFELPDDTGLLAEMRRHALATAIAGEIFGRSAREVDSGDAFLAGLLHDAGALLVHRMLRDQDDGSVIVNPLAARALALRTHQRVGGLLFGEWDLEAGVAATIAWHHTPDLVEDRFAALTQVVHTADHLADIALAHADTEAWQAARTPYAERDDLAARRQAMRADGIDELDITSLLPLVPPTFGEERLRGVIRGVLLRLETYPV